MLWTILIIVLIIAIANCGSLIRRCKMLWTILIIVLIIAIILIIARAA